MALALTALGPRLFSLIERQFKKEVVSFSTVRLYLATFTSFRKLPFMIRRIFFRIVDEDIAIDEFYKNIATISP